MSPQAITHGVSTAFDRFCALISQTGTAVPTQIIMQNELGGVPVWGRTGVGVYTLTLAGIWTLNRTLVQATLANAIAAATAASLAVVRTSSDVLTLSTVDGAGGIAVDLEGSLFLEIKVYAA